MSFLGSVEFYIILAVLAAAIVAMACRPAERGPAQEYLLAGDLVPVTQSAEPAVECRVAEDGKVHLVRAGLDSVAQDGAISLVVKVVGHDVLIEERLTAGRGAPEPAQGLFTLNFLAPGRYHMRYNSQGAGLFAAFPLHVSAGIHCSHLLKR